MHSQMDLGPSIVVVVVLFDFPTLTSWLSSLSDWIFLISSLTLVIIDVSQWSLMYWGLGALHLSWVGSY
jgi:hypothetical protein